MGRGACTTSRGRRSRQRRNEKNGVDTLTRPRRLAPLECDDDTPAGTKVADSCCAGVEPFGLLSEFFATANCQAAPFLPDGAATRPYLGCDDGLPTYGENCVVEGQPFPWPAGTDLTPFQVNASSYQDCGCSVIVQGAGCWKVHDLNEGIFASYALPPYNVGGQVFVSLDACA